MSENTNGLAVAETPRDHQLSVPSAIQRYGTWQKMSNNNNSNKKKRPSMEDSIKETREKINQRQITSELQRQKFTALAEREPDPFKKAVTEDLAAIHFTVTTLWHDLEMLYI